MMPGIDLSLEKIEILLMRYGCFMMFVRYNMGSPCVFYTEYRYCMIISTGKGESLILKTNTPNRIHGYIKTGINAPLSLTVAALLVTTH
jgi:hypothetical protein